MQQQNSTMRSKKHSMAHPVPILKHAAHRRRKRAMRVYASDAYGLIVKTKRNHFCVVPTFLNVTIAVILGVGIIFGVAMLFWVIWVGAWKIFSDLLALLPTLY